MIPNILLFFGVSTVTEVTFLGDEISSEVTSGKFKELVCSSLDVVSSEDADEDDCSVFCCTGCWLFAVWLVLDETAASCLEEEGGATEDGFDDGADDWTADEEDAGLELEDVVGAEGVLEEGTLLEEKDEGTLEGVWDDDGAWDDAGLEDALELDGAFDVSAYTFSNIAKFNIINSITIVAFFIFIIIFLHKFAKRT